MDPRRDVLETAVAQGDAPFLIGSVADASGVIFAAGAGEAKPGVAAGPDTLLRIFSMTKAVAAVAAMILSERGQLDLDAPVTAYRPEFGRKEVLDGWDGETPRLRAPRSVATVRQLATHTSGLAYTHWNAEMTRYRAATGMPAMASGTMASLNYPLAGDPGEAWRYGTGMDWLGLVIETVSGRPIDAFCAAEIFGPLGMGSTVFDLDAGLRARLALAWSRAPDGGFAPLEIGPPPATEFRGMGAALYSTVADYLRFVRLFLGGGAVEGTRVLSEASVAAMLANQIGALRVGPMISAAPRISADVTFFPGVALSHSLVGPRVEADVPGMRRAGATGWAGLLNLQWWVDPRAGRAAVLATQTLPFMEPRFASTFAAFERAVYAA